MKFLFHFGRYMLMLKSLFVRPENMRVYWRELIRQLSDIGVSSLPIVMVISVFVGAVTTVQTGYQLISPLFPNSVIGAIVSDSTLLELAPTITCLVLAGRVGSSIASELATMRVTEQIDALEVMGINITGYLVLPKIVAAVFIIPMLIIIAAALGIFGGIAAGEMSDILTRDEFIAGARSSFDPLKLNICLVKAATFAFIISSVSAYQGFYAKGGALDVGFASTRAVVFSCILILLSDYFIAEIIL